MSYGLLIQAAGFALPTDERIKTKIADLVEGVLSVAEMRRHISHYVSTQLFAGKELPPATDRRFFPTSIDFRNCIYQTRVKKLHSKVDQVNLKVNIDNWQRQYQGDYFHFREYRDDSQHYSTVEPDCHDNEDDEIAIRSSEVGTGLFFCHQTQWQKHLLQRYGGEICLLDATYKTSRYALPLFFVCVKTNVNYAVVASFIVQSEDTHSISEALELLKHWNPDWQPRHWMVDFCEAEINALESVFPGK